MKLNIYLMRDCVTDPRQMILERCVSDGGYTEVKPTQDLPFACCAWIQRNKARAPQWVEWLSAAFDMQGDLQNQSSSFVVGVSVDSRCFAVTFGYGYSAIDRTQIVPDFGLKVTLSVVDPVELDTIDTRTLDRVTKLTRTHLNVGQPANEFGLEPELDLFRSVRGTATDDLITGKVEGSDAVKVNWKDSLSTLGDCCRKLLALYDSGNYKTYFGFIDHLRRLPTSDPLMAILEERVSDLLRQRDREWLMLAHPDVPSPEVDTYKIWSGHTSQENIDELDLDALYTFLDEYENKNGRIPDPRKTWVHARDSQKAPLSQNRELWDYLVAQVAHDGHVYVLSLGQWYRTDRDYLDELRKKVARIDDATQRLDLPSWPKGQDEGEYNKLAAGAKDWLLLDRKMFVFQTATDKIECADLVTPERELVHVKAMTSSSTMSHLFSQGAVSARLFRTSDSYRDRVGAAFLDKYGSGPAFQPSGVVYAIGTDKDGPISKSLFFFSMVNLALHHEMLTAMGYPVSVCRIKRS